MVVYTAYPIYLPLVETWWQLTGTSLKLERGPSREKNEARAISELRKTCYIIGIAES